MLNREPGMQADRCYGRCFSVGTLGIHVNRGPAECATGAAIRLLVDLSKKPVTHQHSSKSSCCIPRIDLLVVPEQAVLLLADLDGAAAELRDQNLVTGLDADGNAVAGLVECARADGEDLGLVQLLDGGLGQEDAACGLGLGLEALDEHAVEERGEGADGLEGRLSVVLVRYCLQ
jgi:hypothetical protein